MTLFGGVREGHNGGMTYFRLQGGAMGVAGLLIGATLRAGAVAGPRAYRVPAGSGRVSGTFRPAVVPRLSPLLAPSLSVSAPEAQVSGLSPALPGVVLAAPAIARPIEASFTSLGGGAPGEETRFSPTAALLEHGPQAAELAGGGSWDETPAAMEDNFMIAAALNRGHHEMVSPMTSPGVAVPGSDSPGGIFGGLFGKKASAKLGRRLLENLDIDDHGNPSERRLLENVVYRLMESPMAREYAEDLLAAGGRAKVSFEEVGGSRVVVKDGKKTFHGIFGETNFDSEVPHVRLSRRYLDSDPDFVMAHAPKALGHELMGHVVYHIKAAALDLVWPFRYYKDNETLSGLVEWIITGELGEKLSNGRMWQYLESPDLYHRNLHVVAPFYAGTFDREEAKDLEGTLRARQDRVREESRQNEEDAKNWTHWRKIVDYFVSAGTVKEESVRDVRGAIEASLENRRLTVQELTEIDKYVSHLLESLAQDEGKKWAAGFLQSMSQPFFAEVEAEVTRLTLHLRDLVARRGGEEAEQAPAPAPPSGPRQMTFDELAALYREDLARNPERWRR